MNSLWMASNWFKTNQINESSYRNQKTVTQARHFTKLVRQIYSFPVMCVSCIWYVLIRWAYNYGEIWSSATPQNNSMQKVILILLRIIFFHSFQRAFYSPMYLWNHELLAQLFTIELDMKHWTLNSPIFLKTDQWQPEWAKRNRKYAAYLCVEINKILKNSMCFWCAQYILFFIRYMKF